MCLSTVYKGAEASPENKLKILVIITGKIIIAGFLEADIARRPKIVVGIN